MASPNGPPMLEHIPRYLVPFDPKRVPHRFTDVLDGCLGQSAAVLQWI
jgi:hypothetical protein